MHECPRCGYSCDCSGDIDDADVMKPEWVFTNCTCDCVDEQFWDDDDDCDEDNECEIAGYYCLDCGHDQANGGMCNACAGSNLEEVDF